MNFEKAYKELLKGKKIRRKEWQPFQHLMMTEGQVKTYTGEIIQYYTDSNILISKGWLVVEGDGKELSFFDCIEELRNKKKIMRKEWIEEGKDQYIFIDHGQFAMCRAVEYQFMPTFACLNANDWEIFS